MSDRISFLITIDAEGDNLWARPREVTTENVSYIPRFQELCEKHQLKPTYLTNYEIATSRPFQEFGRSVLDRNAGEIGMHLHPWDMPPSFQLTDDDQHFHPYLIEYPEEVMRQKVEIMTNLLENVFGRKMVSHRAGRWAVDPMYAKILIEKGYLVDCSVVPHVSLKHHLGDPAREGGPDYSKFPASAYFLDTSDIRRRGQSPLLEIPVTTQTNGWCGKVTSLFRAGSIPGRALGRIFPNVIWLRPSSWNLRHMLKVLRTAQEEGRDYVEFMMHSSEFMPGGSPRFKSGQAIEKLYADLEILFAATANHFVGRTLAEYYTKFTQSFDQ